TTGSVDEIGLVTSGTAADTATKIVTFTDVDYNDTHTASASYVTGSAAWSGAAPQNLAIPAQTLTDLASAVTAQVTAAATHEATGNVTWTASLPDADLDFLAQGETLSATYNITVADNHGGSATEQITVTFNGADDKPTLT